MPREGEVLRVTAEFSTMIDTRRQYHADQVASISERPALFVTQKEWSRNREIDNQRLNILEKRFRSKLVGETELLDDKKLKLLEEYFGVAIELERIYAKRPGDTSTHFHKAVDLRGPTLNIMEVTSPVRAVIGGYCPVSWYAGVGSWWGYIEDAFIFNLTTDTKFLRGGKACYDTFHRSDYGPTFGGGHEIYVDSSLEKGYVDANGNSSYRNYNEPGKNIIEKTGRIKVKYGSVEVFRVKFLH